MSIKDMKDVDGQKIRIGSVLRRIDSGVTGVVIRIIEEYSRHSPIDCVGDIHISVEPGVTRCTNMYGEWRHVPPEEQTYKQRYLSWLVEPWQPDTTQLEVSRDEQLAVSGIVALLPPDLIDWENGPWPDRLETILEVLAEHLTQLDRDAEAGKAHEAEQKEIVCQTRKSTKS